jgi:hypothetical protein
MADAGIVLEITDRLRAFQQARRRLRVLVHRGFLHGGPVPFYFVKVTNLSSDGRVVTDFGAQEYAFGVAIQTDGSIVAAGPGSGDFAVARYLGR